MPTPDRKRALITKLHIAKQQLGMDDDDYRALLRRHGATGETPSSRDMRIGQISDALNEMIGKGWKPSAPKGAGRQPSPARGKGDQMAKIEALLTDKGVRQGSPVPWSYADAIAQRVCKVARVAWCTTAQLNKVIAALEYDKRRTRDEQ